MARLRRSMFGRVAFAAALAALSAAPVWPAGKPVQRSRAVVVETVKPGGPAAAAGVLPGDVILAMGETGAPTLQQVAAYRLAWERARETRLVLSRAGGRTEARLPPAPWGCKSAPDLSGPAKERLGACRSRFEAGEDLDAARRDWEALAGEAERERFADCAAWLRLELAGALWRRGSYPEAIGVLEVVERTAPAGGYWHFLATLWRAGVHAQAEQNERAAEVYARTVAEARKGRPELELAVVLQSWGYFEWRRGRLDEAASLTGESLSIRARLVPFSLDLADAHTNRGNVFWSQGDLAQARREHEAALALREKLLPGSLDVAATLNNLGLVAQELDDLGTAEAYHRRSLEIKRRLAPESDDVAYSLNNLGIVAWKRGDLAEARELHLQALALRERLEPDSLEVAASLDNLAYVATDQGDLSAVRAYLLRALAIQERLAPDSLDVAWSLLGLGNATNALGDVESGRAYLLRALAIRERQAPDSADVAWSLLGLGNSFEQRGDFEEARGYYERALAVHRRISPESLGTAACLYTLGLVTVEEGRSQGARPYMLEAFALREKLAPGGWRWPRPSTDWPSWSRPPGKGRRRGATPRDPSRSVSGSLREASPWPRAGAVWPTSRARRATGPAGPRRW